MVKAGGKTAGENLKTLNKLFKNRAQVVLADPRVPLHNNPVLMSSTKMPMYLGSVSNENSQK